MMMGTRVAGPLMRTMGGRPVLLQRFPEGAGGRFRFADAGHDLATQQGNQKFRPAQPPRRLPYSIVTLMRRF